MTIAEQCGDARWPLDGRGGGSSPQRNTLKTVARSSRRQRVPLQRRESPEEVQNTS